MAVPEPQIPPGLTGTTGPAVDSGRSWLGMVAQRFRRHRMAMVGLVILTLLGVLALLAPALAPYPYEDVDTANRLQPPGREHWMGTDQLGRDILSRVLYGSRISLSVGFVAVGVSITVGILVGSTAGYFGGRVDDILMRLTEVVISFPTFFLLLTVVAIVDRNIFNIMLVIGLTGWTGTARLVRGEFLSLRTREFVEAARASGAGSLRIIFRHILPNATAPLIVAATLGIGGAILLESALAFLGLGVQEPYPSWGSILNAGQRFIRQSVWFTLFPGLMIFLTVLSFNFVGDGLRDALDPKLKE